MLSLMGGQRLCWSQNHAGGLANLHSAFPACSGAFPPGCVVLAGLSELFAPCWDARGRDAPVPCSCTQRLLQEPRLLGERTFRRGFPLPCHLPLVLGKKSRESQGRAGGTDSRRNLAAPAFQARGQAGEQEARGVASAARHRLFPSVWRPSAAAMPRPKGQPRGAHSCPASGLEQQGGFEAAGAGTGVREGWVWDGAAPGRWPPEHPQPARTKLAAPFLRGCGRGGHRGLSITASARARGKQTGPRLQSAAGAPLVLGCKTRCTWATEAWRLQPAPKPCSADEHQVIFIRALHIAGFGTGVCHPPSAFIFISVGGGAAERLQGQVGSPRSLRSSPAIQPEAPVGMAALWGRLGLGEGCV
ncbi:uncharacterized protein LOC118157194 [Oxyura jamaicensis]|uniref:uncharacterized protein LOC118157194 n=1 Tax=Oxyura jamaicensis TaxID=8884 RepID=UPI0015A6549E|nr:uncharacterized protein LOC118157194 [Oxyura jamaicensis]